MNTYTAHIDGASSGNPGDSGIGIVLYKDGEEMLRISKYIGQATNNVAEYTALLTLLNSVKKHLIKKIKIYSDSELLVKQLSGEYKIKNMALKVLVEQIHAYKKEIDFTVEHVGREKNKEADDLAKKASKRGGKINDV